MLLLACFCAAAPSLAQSPGEVQAQTAEVDRLRGALKEKDAALADALAELSLLIASPADQLTWLRDRLGDFSGDGAKHMASLIEARIAALRNDAGDPIPETVVPRAVLESVTSAVATAMRPTSRALEDLTNVDELIARFADAGSAAEIAALSEPARFKLFSRGVDPAKLGGGDSANVQRWEEPRSVLLACLDPKVLVDYDAQMRRLATFPVDGVDAQTAQDIRECVSAAIALACGVDMPAEKNFSQIAARLGAEGAALRLWQAVALLAACAQTDDATARQALAAQAKSAWADYLKPRGGKEAGNVSRMGNWVAALPGESATESASYIPLSPAARAAWSREISAKIAEVAAATAPYERFHAIQEAKALRLKHPNPKDKYDLRKGAATTCDLILIESIADTASGTVYVAAVGRALGQGATPIAVAQAPSLAAAVQALEPQLAGVGRAKKFIVIGLDGAPATGGAIDPAWLEREFSLIKSLTTLPTENENRPTGLVYVPSMAVLAGDAAWTEAATIRAWRRGGLPWSLFRAPLGRGSVPGLPSLTYAISRWGEAQTNAANLQKLAEQKLGANLPTIPIVFSAGN